MVEHIYSHNGNQHIIYIIIRNRNYRLKNDVDIIFESKCYRINQSAIYAI